MSGESSFYIFTRCKESGFDELTTVCCISKELKSARKFITFAVLINEGDDKFKITNLKKQEIPHQTHHIEDLDLSQISFTLFLLFILLLLFLLLVNCLNKIFSKIEVF